MNINIKKKILNYETLKCELEEANILSKEYFERFVNEIYPDKFNDLFIDNNQNCPLEEKKEEEEEEPELTENFKKIYKKLSLKLHPDRNLDLNEEEKIENEELFKEVLNSYESGDFCNLLVRAREFRVKIPSLNNQDLKILSKNIEDISEKIKRIKNQTSWIWCTTNDPGVKDRIRNFFKKTIQESILFDWIIEDNIECAICLEKLVINTTEKRVICGHIFHKSCILSWFSIKFSCPLCRKSFE